MLRPSLFTTRRFAVALAGFLVAITLLAPFHSCGPRDGGGDTEAYFEGGEQWAFGRVDLTYVDVPGYVVLERQTTDQSLDSPKYRYELYGSMQGDSPDTVIGRRDLAYVDYHPTHKKLLAYRYSIMVKPSAGSRSDTVDIYAALHKAGFSYPHQKQVPLGRAVFQKNSNVARARLENGVFLSLIASGVYQGQWALHYPDARITADTPFQGICTDRVAQAPGQNPTQNPTQKVQCLPIPAQVDLCGGKPMQNGCRPRPPLQNTLFIESGATISDLEVVADEDRVFTITQNRPAGKIEFPSRQIAATAANNAELCAKNFYALARTEGNQVNDACVLKPAPSAPKDGMLACALTVGFDNARTYLERICNVMAIFRGTENQVDIVQVLDK